MPIRAVPVVEHQVGIPLLLIVVISRLPVRIRPVASMDLPSALFVALRQPKLATDEL